MCGAGTTCFNIGNKDEANNILSNASGPVLKPPLKDIIVIGTDDEQNVSSVCAKMQGTIYASPVITTSSNPIRRVSPTIVNPAEILRKISIASPVIKMVTGNVIQWIV